MTTRKPAEEIDAIPLLEGVQSRKDPMAPEKIELWKKSEGKEEWMRITHDRDAKIVDDVEVKWVPGFVALYEKVKLSMWQRLRKAQIDGAIFGPGEEQYQSKGPRQDATLMWSNKPDQNFEKNAGDRVTSTQAKLTMLGKDFGLLEGGVPVRFTVNLGEGYGGERDMYVNEHETQIAFKMGMDYILGQVFDSPRDGEHASAPLLRNLKSFRNKTAKWATIQNGREVVAQERGERNSAWMAVVPKNSPLFIEQKNVIQVDRANGMILMRVKPIAITREWAGIVGTHEMEHMENAYTGKEPMNSNREDYIDGEVRAFTVEMGAADILSRGRFLQALDSIIEKYRINSLERVYSLEGDPMMILIARTLDTYITSEDPKSADEGAMRQGLYLFALAFRLAEKESNGNAELLNTRKEEAVKHFYKDLLPKEEPQQ